MRMILVLALMAFPVATKADPAPETAILHIRNDLLSSVLAKGVEPPKVTLAERMAALNVPGVSVAVIHSGKIAWAQGFGVAGKGGAAVTAQTLFQAGSISKPLTAMAVLHLAQAGRFDLDTDVDRYLKSWHVPQTPFTDQSKVTLRALLSHMAGTTVHGFAGYAAGEPVPSLLQVLNGEKPANSPAIIVHAQPGKAWEYSGGGYVVVQQLLEDVTGEPFTRLMRETVLAPLGMTHSTYEQPLPAARLAQAALPHDTTGAPIPGGPHTYPEMAPAGLWTTPSDLARYALEVQRALAGQSDRVLPTATAAEMLKPGKGDFGLGLKIGGGAEHPYFEHDGVNAGYDSYMVAYENGDGVVIMTNGDNGSLLMSPILHTIAHLYGWPNFQPVEKTAVRLEPGAADRLVGRYDSEGGGVVTIRKAGSQLFMKDAGGNENELYAKSADHYFVTAMNVEFIFSPDGKTGETVNGRGGHVASLKKLDKVAIDPAKLDAVVGNYDLNIKDNIRIALKVTREGNRLYVQPMGQLKFELVPETDRDFVIGAIGVKVSFQTDGQGHATQLLWLMDGVESTAARVN
jgi:CubicO group peptidase (beta-lactamase class C family)